MLLEYVHIFVHILITLIRTSLKGLGLPCFVGAAASVRAMGCFYRKPDQKLAHKSLTFESNMYSMSK